MIPVQSMLRRAGAGLTALLLAACAGEAPKPVTAPTPAKPEVAIKPAVPIEQPLPAHLRELRGSLLTPPAGSDVELALLEVDRRDQPDRLLSNVQLKGRDGELPFILQFNPDAFPAGQRVELRGRVTRAGQLIMRLPPRTISSAASQALGPLQLVPAP